MKKQIQYSTSNFIKLLENLILNIGLARVILNVESFGKLQQFFIILTLILTLSSSFPTSLNYFIGRYGKDINRLNSLFKRFFFATLYFSIICSVSFILFTKSLEVWFKNNYYTDYTVFFVFLIILKTINNYYTNFYLFKDKLKYYNLVSFFLLLAFLSMFLFWKLYKTDIYQILLSIVIYEFVKFILYGIHYLRMMNIRFKSSSLVLNKEELYFILPTGLLLMSGIINMQVDKYMISVMTSPEIFAIYQVGAFNIPFVAVVTTSFFTVATPKLTMLFKENKYAELVFLTSNITKNTIVFLVPIFIFSFLFSNEVILVLFGEKFTVSGNIFKIYTLRFLISVFPFSIYMGLIGLKNYASIHVIISVIINVCINLYLIPLYEGIGAVVATVISSYISVVIPILFINKRVKNSFKSYFPIKFYGKIFFLSSMLIVPFFYGFKLVSNEKAWVVIPLSVLYYITTLLMINKFLYPIWEKLRKKA